MKKFNYKIEALKYVLPYFRTNEDLSELLKTIGHRFNNIQETILYLLNSINIKNARGIWLDYAGAEIGAQRDEVDYGNYFCVNRNHINLEKNFYFLTSQINPQNPVTLNDAEYIQKIYAYIGANASCGTRNEIINIVKTITNADKVIVQKTGTCQIDITIYGKGLIITKNSINYIESILTDGVYLNNLSYITK